MAFHKSHLYPKEDQMTSGYMKALGHPARLQIIRQLTREGPCNVEELNRDHPICQSAMSDHLKTLREMQLVNWKEKYPNTYYSVNGKTVTLAEEYLKAFFREL